MRYAYAYAHKPNLLADEIDPAATAGAGSSESNFLADADDVNVLCTELLANVSLS